MQPEDMEGLRTAAEILLRRLREKDYRKWLEVVAISPPHLLGNSAPEPPGLADLGRTIKLLCDQGRLSLTMDPDGIVRGRTPD